jgi:hypothetical protein
MTREQIAEFERFELMTAGVIPLPEPAHFLEEKPEIEKVTAWEVKCGSYGVTVAFLEKADAELAAKTMLVAVDDYETRCKYLKPAGEVSGISAVTHPQFLAHKAALKEHAEKVRAHESKVQAYVESQRACDKATGGMYSDWRDCQSKAELMKRIEATMDEYTKLSGSEDLALKFLSKAFPVEGLRDADEWFGKDYTGSRPRAAEEVWAEAAACEVKL